MVDDFSRHFPLRPARVHEVCGAGSTVFASVSVSRARAGVLWVRERWLPDQINPVGLTAFFDPADLIVAQVKNQGEGLAVMEETLRSGALPMVVTEITRPLGLTEGRRLQLAAEAGQSTGLCLIPEGMGSNAAETRWHCTPVLESSGHDSTLHHWKLIKNKSGTIGAWHVRWDHAARRLALVSAARE